ncbi:MAG: hypothetical protein ABI239_10030 [Aquihabitans sp.]
MAVAELVQPLSRRAAVAILAGLVVLLSAGGDLGVVPLVLWAVLRLALSGSFLSVRASVTARWEVASDLGVALIAGALLIVGPLSLLASSLAAAAVAAVAFVGARRPLVRLAPETLSVVGLGVAAVPRSSIDGFDVVRSRGGSIVSVVVDGESRSLPIASTNAVMLRDKQLERKVDDLERWLHREE